MPETIPASHRDLLASKVAMLATIGPSGRPQLTALWFLAEGDQVKISLNTSRQKFKNLQARPAVSFMLMDHANPSRYVEMRGIADVQPDADYAFADKVGAKYGVDLRTRDKPGDGRVIVTIRPDRVRAWG
ncbi:MAG TPA: PPOX class F420-dependent oxidoreductase [Candidatus Dormibacteraeota bacterium]